MIIYLLRLLGLTGVQIVDICLATRPLNGGLINLQELCQLLCQRRKSDCGVVSEDDCLRAINKLKVLYYTMLLNQIWLLLFMNVDQINYIWSFWLACISEYHACPHTEIYCTHSGWRPYGASYWCFTKISG